MNTHLRFGLTVVLLLSLSPFVVGEDVPTPTPPTSAATSLSVYPEQVSLQGSRSLQRLGVLATYADRSQWDWTREAKFRSASEKIATVDTLGVVRPVGTGTTSIEVQAAGKSASVAVTVSGMDVETPVSFSREVTPILTRAGCNQGACHGAQLGRGGFKLSLLGFDPPFDYPEIVQSAEGRRIVPADPARSILLMKPTLQMDHAGGERFTVDSREYQIVKRWLEDGFPAPNRKDPHVTGVEVWPPHRLMQPGEQQQILVQATWSDGLVEDVTSLAQFDAVNEGVASVTPEGLITARSRGESSVMIRFLGQATVTQVTLPYRKPTTSEKFETRNLIDEKLAEKWRDLGLSPSELSSDEEFLRRVYLDAIGTLPPVEKIREFLADKSPDKRAKMIDYVLDRPEFVDFWTYKWGDLLRINRQTLQDKGMWSFHNWVRASLRDNKPIDQMAREIITAEGSPFTEGPANFYKTARTPTEWSETVVQLFMGVRLQCAKCHHHPFEKWTQEDYYGMTAFFVRLGTKNSTEFGLFGRETVIYLKPTGEQRHPTKGGNVQPHPLDGPEMDDEFDRRVPLAEWLTKKDNPFFARNIVNRFWAYTMGRGLVEPIDDMRTTNPPSIPALLDALAVDFAENDYNLKHLLKTIFSSRAYQLSSLATPENKVDAGNIYYTRYRPKRLTAEQLADALDFATGTQEKYTGLPLGTKAAQLPDTDVKSFLMDTFGRPERKITCECERNGQPNIAQALHLLNGDFVNRKIDAKTGRVAKLLAAKTPPEKLIEELYLVTLSRLPRSEEVTWAKGWIAKAPSLREGAGDLLCVLLNSREFLFNH